MYDPHRHVQTALSRDAIPPHEVPKFPYRDAKRRKPKETEDSILTLPWGPAVNVMFDPQGTFATNLTVRLYGVWEGSKVRIASSTIEAGSNAPVLLSGGIGCDSYLVTAQLDAAPATLLETLVVGYVYEGSHELAEGRKSPSFWSKPAGAALEATRVIKPVGGTLFQVFGFNAGAAARYVQLHDVAGAGAIPVNNLPELCLPVDSGKAFSFDLSVRGRAFANGIQFGISSDATKYVADGAALFRVDAEAS